LICLMMIFVRMNPSSVRNLVPLPAQRGMKMMPGESGTTPSSSYSLASALQWGLETFGGFHTFAIGMAVVHF